jgi:hypothetical protein
MMRSPPGKFAVLMIEIALLIGTDMALTALEQLVVIAMA